MGDGSDAVASPAAGGFVCGSESSLEWIAHVSRVWAAYYGCVAEVGRSAFMADCVAGGAGGFDGVVGVAQACLRGRGGRVVNGVVTEMYGDSGDSSAEEVCNAGGAERGGRLVDGAGCSVGSDRRDGRDSLAGSADEAGVGGVPRRGRWYDHNKKKKLNKKLRVAAERRAGVPEWRRKAVRREDDAVSEESQVLQRSLQEKWTAENKLAKLRAEQQFELLQARDLDRVKRMQAAQVMRTTEQAKVQTEKAFGFLAKTGNVPGVVGEGYVEGTVLTNATPGLTRSAGDTISPDSSASMHEYRLALKAVADSEKKIADLERALARLRIVVPEETAEAERYAGARTTFTLDTDGEPPVADEGFVGDDGKYHTYQRLTHPDWTPSTEKMMAKKGLDMYYDD